MNAWLSLAAADFEPWLKLIGLVVAVSIMAINHLLAGLKKARAQLPPPNATPPHDPAAASMRDDLNSEVKEFLRRAAQQRAGQQPSTVRPGAPTPPARMPSNAPAADRRQDSRRKQRGKTPSKPAAPTVPKLEDSLARRRVTSRLDTSSLDERAQQLSSLDKKSEIEAHIEQTLDRPVGQLTAGSVSALPETSASAIPPEVVEAPTGAAAAEIAAALASPQSIRTAIILNEILARPTDRW